MYAGTVVNNNSALLSSEPVRFNKEDLHLRGAARYFVAKGGI